MRLLFALFTVFFTFLASSQLLSITLRTYGLNPNVSAVRSAIGMVFYIAIATGSLWVLVRDFSGGKKS